MELGNGNLPPMLIAANLKANLAEAMENSVTIVPEEISQTASVLCVRARSVRFYSIRRDLARHKWTSRAQQSLNPLARARLKE